MRPADAPAPRTNTSYGGDESPLQHTARCVSRDAARTMEGRERAARILTHLDSGLDVIGPRLAGGQLQPAAAIGHRVVMGDHARASSFVSRSCSVPNTAG